MSINVKGGTQKAARLIISLEKPINQEASQSDRLSCRDMITNAPKTPICLKTGIFAKYFSRSKLPNYSFFHCNAVPAGIKRVTRAMSQFVRRSPPIPSSLIRAGMLVPCNP